MSKVVLITGGSSGIGKSIGEYLREKGFQVFGSSRVPEKYPRHAFKLVQLDVKDVDSISAAVNQIIVEYGKIDVLVNNAGVGITGPIEEIPNEEIRNHFETNFIGAINMMKAVLPHMREKQSGLIINITSIAGYMGLPYRGVYSASKGALELVTEAMRMEVKDSGIQITSLAPGDFATNIASGRYHAPLKETSPYFEKYGLVLHAIDADVNKANDPLAVAQKVHGIITAENPNVHYKVGSGMQKFSIVLKRILPDKVYEKLLLKHYKL